MGMFEFASTIDAVKKAEAARKTSENGSSANENENPRPENSIETNNKSAVIVEKNLSEQQIDSGEELRKNLFKSKIDQFGEGALLSADDMRKIQNEVDFEAENRLVIDSMTREFLKKEFGDEPIPANKSNEARKKAVETLKEKLEGESKQLENIRSEINNL